MAIKSGFLGNAQNKKQLIIMLPIIFQNNFVVMTQSYGIYANCSDSFSVVSAITIEQF